MNKSALLLAGVCTSVALAATASDANAQQWQGGGYYQNPVPTLGGFHDRAGRMMFGASLGFGGMSTQDGAIQCRNCTTNPVAVSVSGHIGGMLNHRLGLMLELQANAQTIEEQQFNDVFLTQTAAMFAAQYWVSPRLWIKGGIGFANLSVTESQSDLEQELANGGAMMAGAGYELMSNRNMSIDLQGRFIVGTYDGISTKTSSGTVGIGINWF